MKNNQKRDKVLAIGISVLAVIVLVGVGFAFFSASVSNTNHEMVSTETGTLSLKFDDGDNGISGTLNLGESITKKFTLQNTGTLDAYAKINWYNLVNTYTQNSLTYTLEQSTTENGSYSSIGSGNVPTSSTETTKVLKNGIFVPVNTTYYYKLTITLNNLDVEQNSDINATFYSYFNLEEGNFSGVDKLNQLIASANPNSMDIITGEVPSGATCTNTLAYDGTVDNNLRYVGTNPCNYVTFNGETAGWRIIGFMKNVADSNGIKKNMIKLIRSEPLGEYSWDSSKNNINNGAGINNWAQADLMYELNGDYLNTNLSSNTMWYNGRDNQQIGVYDYTKGLKTDSQNLIENVKWNLGGSLPHNISVVDAEENAAKYYSYERGTIVWPQGASNSATCSDGACPRATSWTGKVALMYPSDYGFAVGGNSRNECLGKYILDYPEICYSNDWIYLYDSYQWAITPGTGDKSNVTNIGINSFMGRWLAVNPRKVSPVIYLKSSVSLSSGNGSPENPYTLE